MTPDRAHHRDDREDIECLTHRGRLGWPKILLLDGTASSDQHVSVPPDISVARAMLPHREFIGPTAACPGAAIVGTREADFAPYNDDPTLPLVAHGDGPHITRPSGRDHILTWLYDITGYRYAPAAFWKVAGWEIGWAANFLFRCYDGGLCAQLIMAERQAAAAVRAMWIVHDHGQDGITIESSGTLLVGRALIDLITAWLCYIDAELEIDPVHDSKDQRAVNEAKEAIVQRLRAFARALSDAAAAKGDFAIRKRLDGAVKHARDLVDAISLFTVVSEPVRQRVVRLTELLARADRKAPRLDIPFQDVVASIAADMEMYGGPDCQHLLQRTGWCPFMTAGLERLELPDHVARAEGLSSIRTDLIYKLMVTRRLDHLLEVLPWMGAPSGAFRLTFGGPLGAIAALFEAARAREIALEMKQRLYDHPGGLRLDTHRVIRDYSDPARTIRAVHLETRVGFMLTSSALSHASVRAYLRGNRFDARHPLPTLRNGGIDWIFQASMQDVATRDAVTSAELNQPLYSTKDYIRDAPRFMGMGLADTLAASILGIFPAEPRDPGFNKFVRLANARRLPLKIGLLPLSGTHAGTANRELLRSVLKSIDTPTDGQDADWRITNVVKAASNDVELAEFDQRHKSHIGAGRNAIGDTVRTRAAKLRKKRGYPARPLDMLVDRARTWRSANDEGVLSDDRGLVSLLRGRTRLPGFRPCAQEFAPILWFCPTIDRHIHRWIANGARRRTMPTGNHTHGTLVAEEVDQVTAKMPALFGLPIPPALRTRILVPLFTGLAGITADRGHVR